MIRKTGILCAVLLMAGACATNGTAQRDAALSDELVQIAERSDGNQPGVVRERADGELVLEPYEAQAGIARLEIPEDVPVIHREGRVTARALRAGTDVRVFYRLEEGRRPEVIGVEVLDDGEAQELREQQGYEQRDRE